MSGRWAELIGGPFRASWRAALGWSIALVVLIVSTVAFWPAFRGASGITQAIDQLPAPLLGAFGLEGFGTPAGYLRGGLYELVIPLVFAVGRGPVRQQRDRGRGGCRAPRAVRLPADLARRLLRRAMRRRLRLARRADARRAGGAAGLGSDLRRADRRRTSRRPQSCCAGCWARSWPACVWPWRGSWPDRSSSSQLGSAWPTSAT